MSDGAEVGAVRAPRSVCCRDTAGQERFRTITTAYYRGAMVGAHGAARAVRLPADQRGLRCCSAAVLQALLPRAWLSAGAVLGAGRARGRRPP